MHGEVTARLRELHTTIDAGERHREGVLHNIALNLDGWSTQVRRACVRCFVRVRETACAGLHLCLHACLLDAVLLRGARTRRHREGMRACARALWRLEAAEPSLHSCLAGGAS